jgi:hypothetical protein
VATAFPPTGEGGIRLPVVADCSPRPSRRLAALGGRRVVSRFCNLIGRLRVRCDR